MPLALVLTAALTGGPRHLPHCSIASVSITPIPQEFVWCVTHTLVGYVPRAGKQPVSLLLKVDKVLENSVLSLGPPLPAAGSQLASLEYVSVLSWL